MNFVLGDEDQNRRTAMIPKLAVEIQDHVNSNLIHSLEIDEWRFPGAEDTVEPEKVKRVAEYMCLSTRASEIILA
jgi:hypothetical protein